MYLSQIRIGNTFSLSFGALRERKVRTVLTVLMVVAGSSMMVALNGLTGGFGAFIDRQFSNILDKTTENEAVEIRNCRLACSTSRSF